MLVKTAHDRRQSFTDAQAAKLREWNARRKDSSAELRDMFKSEK